MCIQMAVAVGAAVKPGLPAHVMLNLTSWRLLEHTTFQHRVFWFSQVAMYPSMYDCFQVLDRFKSSGFVAGVMMLFSRS